MLCVLLVSIILLNQFKVLKSYCSYFVAQTISILYKLNHFEIFLTSLVFLFFFTVHTLKIYPSILMTMIINNAQRSLNFSPQVQKFTDEKLHFDSFILRWCHYVIVILCFVVSASCFQKHTLFILMKVSLLIREMCQSDWKQL